MKSSRYNHYYEKDGNSYFYNALCHSFFRFPLATGRKINGLIERPEDLEEASKTLYDKLVNAGFLIKDDFDELEHVRKLHRSRVDSKHAYIVILPTLSCNYACWYCIQDHKGARMDDDTIERVKKAIDRLVNEDKIESLLIEWFGGEPFMFFKDVVLPITQYAKSACVKAGIPFQSSATTNAYYLTPEVTAQFRDIKLQGFQITIDGNREDHNKVKFMKGLNSSFDRALTHINTILSQNPEAHVNLRINYTHKTLNESIVEEVCRHIEKENRPKVTVYARKVWQEGVDKDFSEVVFRMIRSFKDNGFKVESWSPILDFVPCYANRKYYVAITPKGNLIKCTAITDFREDDPMGVIGEDGEFIWKDIDYENNSNLPTFENSRCISCDKLPSCMGLCPRDKTARNRHCKYDYSDFNFKESVIEYINDKY